ncbi:ArnT family glycosyltransferase [Ktedonobacter robiniae]|uniref:Glycosyltransferase RgtA/B/C/D-like domain-containing protein n=1 Tax=Ktedonobacter robiniae TaxID=2778365 RepID=A0ABQ3UKE6_9CHLR|nr:hypothetical protein [Ktedonobacter robiniae]GHO53216.1 hypothetical protein KSB_16910 [Ktedonobacter robiniae]
MSATDTNFAVDVSARKTKTPPLFTHTTNSSGVWRERIFSLLWPCLLVALGLRIFLVVHTHGVIDGDEALVGIQAQRILHGDFPVYFYGQAYMGSLEAYLIAILFALFGPSVWAMRAEPILLSMGVVWLTWRLAGILTEASALSQTVRRVFMTVAALCAAVPPLYDGIIEGRTYGGFIEMLVVILLLLISTIRLTRRWFGGAPRRELAWRWAGLGFLIGLGFWIYPLIISSVLAIALWILGACALAMWRRRQSGTDTARTWWQPARELLLALWGIPTGLIGMAPALGWGATHQWMNISYVFSLGGHETLHQKLSDVERLTESYETCVGPRVIGGGIPYESSLAANIHTYILLVEVVCIIITLLMFGFSFIRPTLRAVVVRQLAGLPMLFAACTVFLFCISSASKSIFIGGCAADNAGRYAAPVMLALPFFLATAFTLVWTFLASRKTPADFTEKQITRVPHRALALAAQSLLVLFLLGLLGAQVATYQLADPAETYQSNYCLADPTDNGPVLAYLQEQHIRYFWASNMLAYPLVFKSGLTIMGADPLPLIQPTIAIDRIPSYTDAVLHADRPSMLFIVPHDQIQPRILQVLDSLNVTYRVARFPSQPGYDVLVVIPLNRSVSPLESPELDLFYCVSH